MPLQLNFSCKVFFFPMLKNGLKKLKSVSFKQSLSFLEIKNLVLVKFLTLLTRFSTFIVRKL